MRRRGFTLAELAVATLLGVLVVSGGLLVFLSAGNAEDRTWLKADAVEEAVVAQVTLERDLAALDQPVGQAPAIVDETAAGLAFRAWLPDHDEPVAVEWRHAAGVLARTVAGARTHAFRLGTGAVVRFSVVDPGFARGGLPVLGAFGNRVAYRITAGAEHPRQRRAITLVGAVPLRVKASRDTFPFWSPIPEVASGASHS